MLQLRNTHCAGRSLTNTDKPTTTIECKNPWLTHFLSPPPIVHL